MTPRRSVPPAFTLALPLYFARSLTASPIDLALRCTNGFTWHPLLQLLSFRGPLVFSAAWPDTRTTMRRLRWRLPSARQTARGMWIFLQRLWRGSGGWERVFPAPHCQLRAVRRKYATYN